MVLDSGGFNCPRRKRRPGAWEWGVGLGRPVHLTLNGHGVRRPRTYARRHDTRMRGCAGRTHRDRTVLEPQENESTRPRPPDPRPTSSAEYRCWPPSPCGDDEARYRIPLLPTLASTVRRRAFRILSWSSQASDEAALAALCPAVCYGSIHARRLQCGELAHTNAIPEYEARSSSSKALLRALNDLLIGSEKSPSRSRTPVSTAYRSRSLEVPSRSPLLRKRRDEGFVALGVVSGGDLSFCNRAGGSLADHGVTWRRGTRSERHPDRRERSRPSSRDLRSSTRAPAPEA